MGHVRPSLWFFINHLKDLEAVNERAARNAENGLQGLVNKRKWGRLAEHITGLQQDYASGRKSLYQYWSAVNHVIHNFR
jgi:hypothetical protein